MGAPKMISREPQNAAAHRPLLCDHSTLLTCPGAVKLRSQNQSLRNIQLGMLMLAAPFTGIS